jgi:peroxiredoxin Q/BCP
MKPKDKAPEFCLEDGQGKEHCLKDYKGKNTVVYFYPKDNSPSCTLEAADFSKHKDKFRKANTEIIGISSDKPKSHTNFMQKKKLTITLLSDEDSKTQKKYGVWRKKKFMGKEYTGTVRSTFLIDKSQKIAKIWDPVSVKGHAEEVLKEAKNLK